LRRSHQRRTRRFSTAKSSRFQRGPLAQDGGEDKKLPVAEAGPDRAVRVRGVDPVHRKHPAFLTLHAEAPLSKDTVEQKHVVSQTFIDHFSEVLIARNPKLDSFCGRLPSVWVKEDG
jgi:hypothetical protein